MGNKQSSESTRKFLRTAKSRSRAKAQSSEATATPSFHTPRESSVRDEPDELGNRSKSDDDLDSRVKEVENHDQVHSSVSEASTLQPPTISVKLPTDLGTPTSGRQSPVQPTLEPMLAVRTPFIKLAECSIEPVPMLGKSHLQCFQNHSHMTARHRICNPTPCMVCHVMDPQVQWRCCFCDLRICPRCMAGLAAVRGRKLTTFLKSFERADGKGKVQQEKEHPVIESQKVEEEASIARKLERCRLDAGDILPLCEG